MRKLGIVVQMFTPEAKGGKNFFVIPPQDPNVLIVS